MKPGWAADGERRSSNCKRKWRRAAAAAKAEAMELSSLAVWQGGEGG
uniref:Uncharacterized protein n=1 Tax=Arundo donax TaxID=35708 RepID=A0A0A9GSC3_ARUDO